jgi:integrase
VRPRRHAFVASSSTPALWPSRCVSSRSTIALRLTGCGPGGLHRFDIQRLDELDASIGGRFLSRTREAWSAWLRTRGHWLAPSTIARWRSTLLAALRHGADEFGLAAPSLPPVRRSEIDRIAYLTPQQEARLLAAYSQWAAPVMLVLCETGLRTQEALRLDWRHIDWQHGVIVVEHSGRRGRTEHEDRAIAPRRHAACGAPSAAGDVGEARSA